jgi:serine/threonine-protein phosphatase PGAM5
LKILILDFHHSFNFNARFSRQPEMLVKPPKKSKSAEQTAAACAEWEGKVKGATAKVTRRIVLIRHGQYEDRATSDEERVLTPLGREQAALTGQRLRLLLEHFKSLNRDENGNEKPLELNLTMSTMTRARETAQIILEHLPEIPTAESYLLREGAPIEPEPPLCQTVWNPEPHVSLRF